ncbi:hypothetical protein [Streptomyces atacamensis]|uniref:hypothetical protein n=1 Tax=Streptomyces atacamensis TaxID=531966 RepID=UPI00399C5B2A
MPTRRHDAHAPEWHVDRVDRLAGVRENGNDLWLSHKCKRFGGNVQFLAAPDGTPHGASPAGRAWGRTSDAEPGSTPDITTARTHTLPALYKAAADGLPTPAGKGYIGAGIGIRIPVRRPKGKSEQTLHVGTRVFNTLLRHVWAFGEHTAAELKQRWRPPSTSRSVPAGSAAPPAVPSPSTESGNDHR